MSAPQSVPAGCVVEASAGTGKTTALVNAVADAIASGVPVEKIAAVTFTHQAAGEMKLRVRQELDKRGTAACAAALQTLDRAFIGTIHSFCAHLLRQRPVEACVDPDFGEMDEAAARRLFGSVFRTWCEEKLATPTPAFRRALARLAWRDERGGAGPLEVLEGAAWRLAEWRDHDAPWEERPFDREPRIDALLVQARAVFTAWCDERRGRDRSLQLLADITDSADRVRAAGGVPNYDDLESELLSVPKRIGWATFDKRTKTAQLWNDLLDCIKAFRREADASLAAPLRNELWDAVQRYQVAKQRAGVLDFLDLLLYARDLLRHPDAQADLRERFDRVFVDEFQDTDPVQAEILLRLADPSNLFVVGDPKQSIYRFRRADPGVYGAVRDRLKAAGAGERKLATNYRSTEAIQRFVNAAFDGKIPDYLPLTGAPPAPLDQPSIVALPVPRPYDGQRPKDKQILACSPSTAGAFIEWLIRESGWTVRDKDSGNRVPVEAKHICLLFRRFANNGVDLTQEYVRSLEARGIDHVLVGSKGLHAREEVGTIRTALRAIEWPGDELSVFAVLRGPLFAIDDGTLFKFRSAFRRFNPFAALPDELDEEFAAVRDGLELIARLHNERNERPIAETMRLLLAHVRGHASFAFHKGGVRRLANLHRLAEVARSADVSGAYTFRSFVQQLEDEAEGGEAAEAPVIEQQASGVTLMTVHKAKGLQAPVVILADMSCKMTGGDVAGRWLDTPKRMCAQRLLGWAPWELLDHEAEEEQQEQAEAVRLAYVAATRARDLLVVMALGDDEYKDGWLSPLYEALYPPKDRRRYADPAPGCPPFGNETVLNAPMQSERAQLRPGLHKPRSGQHEVVWFDPAFLNLKDPEEQALDRASLLDRLPEKITAGLSAYQDWLNTKAAVLENGKQPRWTVRTATESYDVPEAASVEVEYVTVEALPQRPAGWRFGKLLHAILQTGGGAAAHGRRIGAKPAEIAAAEETARIVMAHPLLSTEGRRVFREMPVLVKLDDGTLIEGRVDLAFTDGLSWTVVDYKTGADDRKKGTRQLQLYAFALMRATGLPARAILMEI